jgi:hypothetical protein
MLKDAFLYIVLSLSFFKDANAAKIAGIVQCTVQGWAQRLRNEPDGEIYEK